MYGTEVEKNHKLISIWVNDHSEVLFNKAFSKTGRIDIAEDLVQETFMAALKSISGFEDKSQPLTWLYAILNHKIADHFRHVYSRKSVENALIHLDGVTGEYFDSSGTWKKDNNPAQWIEEKPHPLDNSEFNAILKSCISSLPEVWASVIRMKYQQVLNSDFICQELGIKPTNLWQIMHRAKLQLRDCIGKNWHED